MGQLRVLGRTAVTVSDEAGLRAALSAEATPEARCVQLVPEPRQPSAGALLVGLNEDRGTLWWSCPAQRESLLTDNGSNTDVVWYRSGSEENDFPPYSEISLVSVLDAAAEFLRTGQLPSGVDWIDEDAAWDRHLAARHG